MFCLENDKLLFLSKLSTVRYIFCSLWCSVVHILMTLLKSFRLNDKQRTYDIKRQVESSKGSILFMLTTTKWLFGNGNGKKWENPVRIPWEWELVTKLGMGMRRNGNWLHGNGREWECEKPFPVIFTFQLNNLSLTLGEIVFRWNFWFKTKKLAKVDLAHRVA